MDSSPVVDAVIVIPNSQATELPLPSLNTYLTSVLPISKRSPEK